MISYGEYLLSLQQGLENPDDTREALREVKNFIDDFEADYDDHEPTTPEAKKIYGQLVSSYLQEFYWTKGRD